MARRRSRHVEHVARARADALPALPLVVPLTRAERRAVDDVKALAGLGADADVGRLALWRLADWYQLNLSLDYFAIGGPAKPSSCARRRTSRRRAI